MSKFRIIIAFSVLFFSLGVNFCFAQLNPLDNSNTIADKAIKSVLPGVQFALSKGITPIVRVGVQTDASGMENANNLIKFAQLLDSQVSQPVYLVAGPNEPETELWASPGCSDGQTDCIGPKVVQYMNKIISGTSSLKNIKLMSPVFNLCSPVFPNLIKNMSGANWSGLSAIGVNVYNGTPSDGDSSINNCLNNRLPLISSDLPIIITETGAYDKNKSSFKNEINALPNRVIGALLFNGFNTNTDWSQFSFSDSELDDLCDKQICSSKRLGINFATIYTSGDYDRAARFGMKFTLEILGSGGSFKIKKLAPDRNNGPNLSYNYGYGYTKTSENLDPASYAQWYDGRVSQGYSKAGKPVTLDPNADDYSTKYVSGSDTQLGSGYVYDQIALVQPRRYLDLAISALNKDQIISSIQSLHHDFSGFTPNYRKFYENMVGPNLNTYRDLPKNTEEFKRRTYDYESGINAQAIPEKNNDDQALNDWLCRLGASVQGVTYLADKKTRPVADEEISCGDGCTAANLTKFLPNGDINWQETDQGTYKPYRASSIYCALHPPCPGSYGPQNVDCSQVTPVDPNSELFTVLKTKLKRRIAVSEDTASKAFLQSCVEINDPADDHPKNCEDLMLDPATRSKYGLPDLLPKPGDETASNRISKVDWGKMDNKTKNNILTLYKDKSGYFYHSMPNSCRLCMVTPGTITNATRAKAATDTAMSFMPASYRTAPDKIKNIDYGHATPDQAVQTDKQAPIGIINQPAPNVGVFRYSPANKLFSGQIQELLTRIASFALNVVCSPTTTTFSEGELGKDPQTGEPTKPSSHSFNLCRTTYTIPIDTTLFASKDLQLYSQNGQTYYKGLAPQKDIQKVQKARGGKTLLDNTDIEIKLTDSGQMPSEHDFGKADLMGNGGLTGSSATIRDKDKMESSTIYLNESIDDYSCLTKGLLPANWQSGDWASLYTNCPNNSNF